MRNLVLFLLGIAAGAVGATNIVNALRQRDAYPRGLMNVMQHYYATLREDVPRNRCTDAAAQRLHLLHELAGEIETAVYGDDTPDAPFRDYNQHLLDAIPSPPAATDCAALTQALDRIGAACDACHRQYR